MALKECKECSKKVSTSAKQCPNCGVQNPTVYPADMVKGFLTLVVIVVLFVAFSKEDKADVNETKERVKNQETQPTQYPKKESNDTICKRLDSGLYTACMIQLMGK